jgi:hypothetical protein
MGELHDKGAGHARVLSLLSGEKTLVVGGHLAKGIFDFRHAYSIAFYYTIS